MYLLSFLLACAGPTEDKLGDSTSPGDTGEPGPDWSPLEAVAACGSARFLLDGAQLDLALSVELDVYAAALSGSPATVTSADAAPVAVLQEGLAVGDVCSSIEEFPPVGSSPSWQAEASSFSVTFTPSQAWPAEGSWGTDGTVIGAATLTIEGTWSFVPHQDSTGPLTFTFDAPRTFTADLSKSELPA
jgi:hypothetical protein